MSICVTNEQIERCVQEYTAKLQEIRKTPYKLRRTRGEWPYYDTLWKTIAPLFATNSNGAQIPNEILCDVGSTKK